MLFIKEKIKLSIIVLNYLKVQSKLNKFFFKSVFKPINTCLTFIPILSEEWWGKLSFFSFFFFFCLFCQFWVFLVKWFLEKKFLIFWERIISLSIQKAFNFSNLNLPDNKNCSPCIFPFFSSNLLSFFLSFFFPFFFFFFFFFLFFIFSFTLIFF